MTASDSSAGAVTVNTSLPETVPDVTVMVVDPAATPSASPVAFTVATLGVVEVQVTLLVRSAVLVSLKVPVATSCCVKPLAMLGAAGVMAMESSPLTKDTRTTLLPALNK